ncbi:MAG: hypothetical protein D6739_02325 [Nitrospirae bacterium]|nr:MAG: hypothetical protein D6739_02325 [Nitrospirota bacterium]
MFAPIPELTPEDQAFLRRFRRQYAPKPMDAAAAAAFDRRLEARLRRPRWPLAPALGLAAAAALVALVWGAIPHPPRTPRAAPAIAANRPPAEWSGLVASYRWATGGTEADFAATLPEDYRILAADYLDR